MTLHSTPPSPSAPPSARAVFAVRDFRLFLACRFLSAVAQQMLGVAVGWQVYDLTHDALHLGYVGLALFLPAFLLSLPGGQVADRFDRRGILAVCLAVQVAVAAALLVIALDPAPRVGAIYAVLTVMGAARAFLAPASQSMVPLLVGPALFPRAVALSSSSWQVAVIAGPALGGLLYAFGPATVFGTAAVLLVAAMLAVTRLKVALQVKAAGRPPGLTGLFDGVRYVWSRPDILGAISLDLFAVLLGGATALLPIYARDILHIGPLGLGVLRSAPAAGAAITALVLAHRPLERGAGPRLFVAVAMFGLATVAFGLSTSFPLSLAALLVLGAADMISVVVRQTLVQLRTPDEMRGRVSAVNMVFIGASNELGEFESGLTAAWLGTVPAVVLGGVGTLAIAALWAWRFPALRRIDRLAPRDS
jgi:MFS family permease